jgi:hypothetical protein
MSRAPLIVICAVALAALVIAPAASAKTASTTNKKCVTSSKKVVGKKVTGRVSASNVNPTQAQFASCGQAKRVMKKVIALGLEQPRDNVAGFRCVPTVYSTGPDFVRYICTFKSADTPMVVKLRFAVEYEG